MKRVLWIAFAVLVGLAFWAVMMAAVIHFNMITPPAQLGTP